MTDDPRIRLSVEDGVATLLIDREEKLNALDAAMVRALHAAALRIDRDRSLRVVILTGAGRRAFSAGGDIEAWSGESAEDFGRFWIREGHDAFDAIARLSQPVIAVLNGHALGGGLEIAAAADIRIAEEHARLGQPETGIGIIPGWSGTQRAVRRLGAQAVRRMALFGAVFTAAEALALGLVEEVVATGGGMARARELAAAVVRRGPRASEVTKMLINAAEGEERERPIEALAGAFVAASDELGEGIAAFREKRPPVFRTRRGDG